MKRVLLLGDYSGFNKNLKKGLEELGCNVTLFSNGDYWKKISGGDDILYNISSDRLINKFNDRIIQPIINRKRFYGYDIVQSIHEVVFEPYINSLMLNTIKERNGQLFINKCGNSVTVYRAWKAGKLGYYIFDGNPDKYKRYTSNRISDILARKSEDYVDKIADGIVPMGYEYAVGISGYRNRKPTIAQPIDLSELDYSPNIVKDRIVFYHGITRSADKGSDYIQKAFEIIQRKYPNDVKMIIADKMPYDKYIETIKKANVIVDDCKGLGWGMNSCIAMALGRLAMSHATRESYEEFGLRETPIFCITHDVNQIVSQIESIIEKRNSIEEMGFKSREFVENNHDCIKVAEKYIKVWCNEDIKINLNEL